jgi:predicted PurR-regulated permease PerM
VLTAFFFFFFSTGWGRVLGFWEGLVPERKKGIVLDLVRKMDRVIAGFIRGRLTIVGILLIFVTMGYWLIGVPVPLIVGPIYGLLFLVPYLAAVGVPVAMLLMWLEPVSPGWQTQWWWIVLAPIAVHMGAQILDDYILSPIIQGKSTDMDTPTILFASIAGGALAGVYGLLLAIPVAACIKILVKELVWPRVHAYLQGRAPDILPIEGRRGP